MVFIIPTPFILTASEITSVSSYGDQGLQLFRCDNKPSERYTHVSIVVADYGVLDHLGAQKLVVDVALPTHGERTVAAVGDENPAPVTTLTLDTTKAENF